MLASNEEIYTIFRKDLHLSEEKTRKLVSNMDTAIGEAQVQNFATKTEVSEISIKLGDVKDEIKEIKVEVKQIREKMEGLIGTVCTRIGYFIAGAVGILTILNIVLNIVVAVYKK